MVVAPPQNIGTTGGFCGKSVEKIRQKQRRGKAAFLNLGTSYRRKERTALSLLQMGDASAAQPAIAPFDIPQSGTTTNPALRVAQGGV